MCSCAAGATFYYVSIAYSMLPLNLYVKNDPEMSGQGECGFHVNKRGKLISVCACIVASQG